MLTWQANVVLQMSGVKAQHHMAPSQCTRDTIKQEY